jgi:hypothetical protein
MCSSNPTLKIYVNLVDNGHCLWSLVSTDNNQSTMWLSQDNDFSLRKAN